MDGEARLYKLSTRGDWEQARKSGTLPPSAADRRDGYVHLCTGPQVRQTAALHFHGVDELLALAIDASRLPADALVWELARGGQRFPHLYAELNVDAVVGAEPLPLDASGTPMVPEHLG